MFFANRSASLKRALGNFNNRSPQKIWICQKTENISPIDRIYEAVGSWYEVQSTNMVESIFGGKVAYPLGCYEKSISHPRVTERRLSVQSTQLKTISESGDDNYQSESTRLAHGFETITASEGLSYHRRPRTMSLPAIYRDGSYLIIRRASNAPISCQRRRYSEPAGLKTQGTIQSLSPRKNDSYSVSAERENASWKRSSVESGQGVWRSGVRDLLTPRRHSDPMCLVTAEQVEKSPDRQERWSRTVDPQLTGSSVCGKNRPQMQTDSNQAGRQVYTRRRKSSLVPVPFNAPVLEVQKARHSQPASSRRLSFPPSKKESQRHCILPALNLKTGFFAKYISNENKESEIGRDCNNNLELAVDEQPFESENSADLKDKYATDEAILVQWMKFFG